MSCLINVIGILLPTNNICKVCIPDQKDFINFKCEYQQKVRFVNYYDYAIIQMILKLKDHIKCEKLMWFPAIGTHWSLTFVLFNTVTVIADKLY